MRKQVEISKLAKALDKELRTTEQSRMSLDAREYIGALRRDLASLVAPSKRASTWDSGPNVLYDRERTYAAKKAGAARPAKKAEVRRPVKKSTTASHKETLSRKSDLSASERRLMDKVDAIAEAAKDPKFSNKIFTCRSDLEKCRRAYGRWSVACGLLFLKCALKGDGKIVRSIVKALVGN